MEKIPEEKPILVTVKFPNIFHILGKQFEDSGCDFMGPCFTDSSSSSFDSSDDDQIEEEGHHCSGLNTLFKQAFGLLGDIKKRVGNQEIFLELLNDWKKKSYGNSGFVSNIEDIVGENYELKAQVKDFLDQFDKVKKEICNKKLVSWRGKRKRTPRSPPYSGDPTGTPSYKVKDRVKPMAEPSSPTKRSLLESEVLNKEWVISPCTNPEKHSSNRRKCLSNDDFVEDCRFEMDMCMSMLKNTKKKAEELLQEISDRDKEINLEEIPLEGHVVQRFTASNLMCIDKLCQGVGDNGNVDLKYAMESEPGRVLPVIIDHVSQREKDFEEYICELNGIVKNGQLSKKIIGSEVRKLWSKIDKIIIRRW